MCFGSFPREAAPMVVGEGFGSFGVSWVRRCGDGVGKPLRIFFLRLRSRHSGASSSAVGRPGGPVQELGGQRVWSPSRATAVALLRRSGSSVHGWWLAASGSAPLHRLHRLKLTDPRSGEHGISPGRHTPRPWLHHSQRATYSAHKAACSAMVLDGFGRDGRSSFFSLVGVCLCGVGLAAGSSKLSWGVAAEFVPYSAIWPAEIVPYSGVWAAIVCLTLGCLPVIMFRNHLGPFLS